MKAMVVIAGFLLLLGCTKENKETGLTDLNGTWELRVSDGGLAYAHMKYPAGNGNTLTFTDSDHYNKVYINNGQTTTVSGTYSVASGTTSCDNRQVNFIRFSASEPASPSVVSIVNDSLYIKVNSCLVADGVDYTYVKSNSALHR